MCTGVSFCAEAGVQPCTKGARRLLNILLHVGRGPALRRSPHDEVCWTLMLKPARLHQCEVLKNLREAILTRQRGIATITEKIIINIILV